MGSHTCAQWAQDKIDGGTRMCGAKAEIGRLIFSFSNQLKAFAGVISRSLRRDSRPIRTSAHLARAAHYARPRRDVAYGHWFVVRLEENW